LPAPETANITEFELAKVKRSNKTRELLCLFIPYSIPSLELKSGETFSKKYIDLALNAEFVFLPFDEFTPYVYGGFGMLYDIEDSRNDPSKVKVDPPPMKIQGGLGLLFYVSETIGIKAFAEGNLTFSDNVDLVESGKRDDYYYNFGIGINYYFGQKKIDKKIINPELIDE